MHIEQKLIGELIRSILNFDFSDYSIAHCMGIVRDDDDDGNNDDDLYIIGQSVTNIFEYSNIRAIFNTNT